jgi:hypothetical protein
MPENMRNWPLSRFINAATYYSEEFCLVKSPESSQISQIRSKLGDFIGRAIRFYLRQFFNPVPVSLHTYSDAEQPDYDFSRSSVYKIIEMSADNGLRDTAAADGSISSVISLALFRINEFFELNARLIANTYNCNEKYINSFFNRQASVNGLQRKGSTVVLSEHDLDEILRDIHECHTIFAGVRAFKFFHSVMQWPGVANAIDDVGGWGKVEHFSSLFSLFDLEKEVPEERHFKLLSNVGELVRNIDRDLEVLCKVEEECDKSLRRTWKRFRCGTKSKELLRINPGIEVIQQHLKAGGEAFFPSIVACNNE